MKLILVALLLMSSVVNAEDEEIVSLDNLGITGSYMTAKATNTTDEEFSSVVLKVEFLRDGMVVGKSKVIFYDIKPHQSWDVSYKIGRLSNGLVVTDVIHKIRSKTTIAQVN